MEASQQRDTPADISALEQKLLSMDMKKFVEFDLNGYKTVCKILKIHDPDSCQIGFKWSSRFYHKQTRWNGIDAPELHSKNGDEAKLCRLGREYLISKYLNKLVDVEMGPSDKYGRILVNMYDRDTGECINDKLIECKFARKYGGDLHKNPWTDAEIQAGITIAGGMGLVDPGK